MLCWNAGGLSSSLYQELIAWCDLQSSLELVVVQETHWDPPVTIPLVNGWPYTRQAVHSPKPTPAMEAFSFSLVPVGLRTLRSVSSSQVGLF